jgi:hypothetical protein
VTNRGSSLPRPRGASWRPARGESPSSAAPGSAAEHSLACSRLACHGSASAPERSLMAADPKLPRFARPSCHWLKGGQSRIDRQGRAVCKSAPWQHLQMEVLHFVCELRGPIAPAGHLAKIGRSVLPAMTTNGSPGMDGFRQDDSERVARAVMATGEGVSNGHVGDDGMLQVFCPTPQAISVISKKSFGSAEKIIELFQPHAYCAWG